MVVAEPLPYGGGGRRPKRLPEVLSEAELTALIRQPNRRSPTGIRNQALLLVMGRCALRVSEALALRTSDISEGWIRVREGKGGKDRSVPLDTHAAHAIDLWLAARRKLGIRARTLFTTITERGDQFTSLGERQVNQATEPGKPLSRVYVWKMVRRYAAEAGIERRIHPHTLRHTCGTQWLRSGLFNLREVQQMMGHASSVTTEGYTHVFDADLQRRQQAMPSLDL